MNFLSNLSILLSVYNGGEKFKRLLQSLENLNSKSNIIIFKDGSTDDSYLVGCGFAKSSSHRMTIIDGKKNRGYFRTIKIMLKICQTDFFIFLGHDDQLTNNFLDEFETINTEQKNIACIFTEISTVTPEGLVIKTLPKTNLARHGVQYIIPCSEVTKTFNQQDWGNLFVSIWYKRVLSHKTLLQIMRCIPNSALSYSLKRAGFFER